jgi:hypothetical protein
MSEFIEFTTKAGKKIYIYDNLFDLQFRQKMFSFIKASLFQIGWEDSYTEEGSRYKSLHSKYSPQDNEANGWINAFNKTDAVKHLTGLKITKSMVNLSVPSDTNFVHSHPEKFGVLYYVNLDWRNHWHGETLFFNEDEIEIELALAYTPGRVVVFDCSIPHTIRPQSISADQYRFTFSTFYDDPKILNNLTRMR